MLQDQTSKTITCGIVLLFIAGYINATTFLCSSQFVTHLTGSMTQIGISVGKANTTMLITTLVIPVFFFLGAVLSGYFTIKPRNPRHLHRPEPVIELIGLCLLGIAFAEYLNYFEKISLFFGTKEMQICTVILALLSGFQNGAISNLSKGALRTTHLTGLVTDLGLSTFRLIAPYQNPQGYDSHRTLLQTRLVYLSAFVVGAVLGSIFFVKYSHLALLLPSTIALLLGRYLHHHRIQPQELNNTVLS